MELLVRVCVDEVFEEAVSSPNWGSLSISTWPERSPTQTSGSEGWTAWAKMSEVSGRLHTVSKRREEAILAI
jgi:hypothetical protein